MKTAKITKYWQHATAALAIVVAITGWDVVYAAAAGGSSVSSQSQSSSPFTAGEVVFGVVNNQKIILAVPEGIKAKKSMQDEVDKAQASLNQQRLELESMGKDLESKADLMSADAKQKKRDELYAKMQMLRDEEMKFQQSIRQKEFQATQGIVEKIAMYVKEIALEKNLFAVFESSQSGIMFIKQYLDITDDVILKFSEKPSSSADDKKNDSSSSSDS